MKDDKPYKIQFTSVPSYNNDGAEWWKYVLIDKATGDIMPGSSRAGTQEEITIYIDEMMKKRKSSISCHDKPVKKGKFKRGCGINLPNRKRVKYG